MHLSNIFSATSCQYVAGKLLLCVCYEIAACFVAGNMLPESFLFSTTCYKHNVAMCRLAFIHNMYMRKYYSFVLLSK